MEFQKISLPSLRELFCKAITAHDAFVSILINALYFTSSALAIASL